MSESLSMPTRGGAKVSEQTPCRVDTPDGSISVNWTSTDGTVEPRAEANADLIAAAFNAAEACRVMGYDPIAAVQALSQLLAALRMLLVGAESVGGYAWEADQSFYEGQDWAHSALAAARTRSQP